MRHLKEFGASASFSPGPWAGEFPSAAINDNYTYLCGITSRLFSFPSQNAGILPTFPLTPTAESISL